MSAALKEHLGEELFDAVCNACLSRDGSLQESRLLQELESLRARARRLNAEEEKIQVKGTKYTEGTSERSNVIVEGIEERDANKDMTKFLLSTAKSAVAQEMDARCAFSNVVHCGLQIHCERVLRSVFVGNVDYGATAKDLAAYMSSCGKVNRITILCNQHDGSPKGAAYVEFAVTEARLAAMALDNTIFRGRHIKVLLLYYLCTFPFCLGSILFFPLKTGQ
jgi:hypothetical protein